MKRLLFSLAVLAITTVSAQRAEAGFTLLGSAWNPGAGTARLGGNPAAGAATWSIMNAGLDMADGPASHGANLTVDFDGLLTVVGREAQIVDETLDLWAAVSDFTNLGLVADGGGGAGAATIDGGSLGDIRVAAWEITKSTTLAHAFQPGTPALFSNGNLGGDLHMDVTRNWVDNAADTTGNGEYDFFTVMLHEIGHSLGLGHSTTVGSVMEPIYGGGRRSLTADDIAGIQAIYGPNSTTVVPEPSTFALLGIGCIAVLVCRRRRKV